MGEPRGRGPAEGETEVALQVMKASRASCVWCRDVRRGLAEGPAGAGGVAAAQTAQPQAQADGVTLAGQVGEVPLVGAVDAVRPVTAGGTARFCRPRHRQHHHVLGLGRDGDDPQRGRNEREQALGHGRTRATIILVRIRRWHAGSRSDRPTTRSDGEPVFNAR